MRVTAVLRRQHLGNQFIYHWMIQGRKKIRDDGVKAALSSKGINIVDPKDVLTPVIPKKEVPEPPQLKDAFTPPPPEKRDTPCHVFTKRFSPIMGLSQAQLITNTLVRTALPRHITDRADAAENTPEMDDRVKEAILHAHLLDTHQERLPRLPDVTKHPGWVFPIEYGIPLRRKNKTLNYQLLLLLDQVEGCGLERQLVEGSSMQVLLPHGNRLMQMRYDAAYLVSSPHPLPAVASLEEVQAASANEEMPDIYPMSPFINCRARDTYSLDERYGVESPSLHPHTVFMHHNQPRMRQAQDGFMGMSLLYAFSHAAAYAKLVQKNPIGDLKEPVTVQVVHIHCQHYHVGVFQLNTLSLTPSSENPTRNLFWTQTWDCLFDSCKFETGRPVLQGYNPRVFNLLRALHAQG
ncbi:large ribosomal subunit protein mL37-like [Scylla paramamosain]|uniref:large ribosomal subunit protein mL37-like n=1 Tax=Scylla paramamosain TaxID=85552 RepID=UPI003082701D